MRGEHGVDLPASTARAFRRRSPYFLAKATLQRLDERLLRLKLHDLRANVTQVLLGNGTHGGNMFDIPAL